MPVVKVESGQFTLQFQNLEDWIQFVNLNVVPAGQAFGFRVVVEPLPKDEPHVNRT
jgi:hypothetical protein